VLEPKTKEEKGSIPIEDIAFLVLDHPQITITHYLMVQLIGARAAIISCDAHHLPHSLQIPFTGHTEHTERILQQKEMSEPLKKQLWKQTVEEKIHNQGRLLAQYKLDAQPLFTMMNEVKSGDTTNREGVAAKYYWDQLFNNFTRDRFGDAPNNLLNFGYAVLRAVIARALSSAGFHLALGIHHKSKYNASCLADDIMEPYRPFVDKAVLAYIKTNGIPDELTKEAKAHLLQIMQTDVYIDKITRPLQIASTITAASLYKCITGTYKNIRYPML
jgi:CRISPR-associated protein Cas1